MSSSHVSSLTASDVRALLSDPTPEARARTAEKVAALYAEESLGDAEQRLAEDILRSMLQTLELRTREALSDHLKTSKTLPHDIAVALADDVGSVALPMIRFSEVLTDPDLINIIRTQSKDKMLAIARRTLVSGRISDAIVRLGDANVVHTLITNNGAEISEPAMHTIVNKMGERDEIQEALVQRDQIPLSVAERLVSLVADGLREELCKRYDVSPDTMDELIESSRVRSLIDTLWKHAEQSDMERLIAKLHGGGQLRASTLIYALRQGKLAFAEICLMRLAQLTLADVRNLLHSQGPGGVKKLYVRAGLARGPFGAFLEALEKARTDHTHAIHG